MKAIENSILRAIKEGNHTSDEIVKAAKLEFQYQDFCKAISNLLIQNKIETRQGERGYFLVSKSKKTKIYEVIFEDERVSRFQESSKEQLEEFKSDIKALKKEDCVNMQLDLDKDKIIAGGTTELIRVFVITNSNPNKELTKATVVLNLNCLYKTLNYVLE